MSRSDQDSRRKTVEEIKRRAQSNGKWPQVEPDVDFENGREGGENTKSALSVSHAEVHLALSLGSVCI